MIDASAIVGLGTGFLRFTGVTGEIRISSSPAHNISGQKGLVRISGVRKRAFHVRFADSTASRVKFGDLDDHVRVQVAISMIIFVLCVEYCRSAG